ncbi:MAG: hypothetical protein IJT79_07945 [Ruminococcus sp.]|nr:hypothetical protein [Ruminococcus sp.]
MKHKENKKGLGLESSVILLDYYQVLKGKEWIWEFVFPIISSLVVSIIYCCNNAVIPALRKLSDLLPTTISILIGFTTMIITLLITSESEKINTLKQKTIENKIIRDKEVSLYQKILIKTCHSLFIEITLLFIVFIYLFLHGINITNIYLSFSFLVLETLLLIETLISIFSNIKEIYFAFYK